MPAKARAPRKTSKAATDKSASTPVGDDVEPTRFTAGTGPLADEMQNDFERTALQAKAIRLQKLDAGGAPVGDPVHLDGPATLHLQPTDTPDVAALAADMNRLQQEGVTLEFSTDDPATVAVVRELTRIPIPTAVINQWWPAFVRVPGDDTTWNLCKVFLTPQGLYVYRAKPPEPETFTSGAMPTWYSSVNFEETIKPVSGYAARNAGIPIVTAAGKVTVQPTTGCGCQARGLKGWRPDWLRNVISWEDGVKLAAGSTDGR
jgi:hypothetical protein